MSTAETTRDLPVGYQHRWFVMAVVMAADVMDLLDATVANLAGPSIRRSFGAGQTTLQWVLAGYTLAFAIGLITSARAGDLLGRRPMFIVGMAGFTLASLACGLAPTAETLILFRILQGLFGAVMLPHGFAMVRESFPEDELQKAFIPFGPIMGLAAVVGPILAGVLIDWNLWGSGWRLIFWINVPIGLVGAFIAWRHLPRIPKNPDARLDPLGSVLVMVASAALIYPLVQGRTLGWPAWTYAMIAGSLVLFLLFGISERRSTHPVIEPSLFANRSFLGGLFFLGTFFVAMNGSNLIMNLFLQLGRGFTPIHAGLTMVPYALGIAIGAAASGAALGPRFGRHVLHAGLVVAAIGMAWFGLAVSAHAGTWTFTPALLVTGFGSGLIFAPLFDIILAGLQQNEVGTGSGLLNAVQQFCGALGVAVLGTVFFQWLPHHGWETSTRWIAWVTVGCFAASFLVAFLLPLKARENEGH